VLAAGAKSYEHEHGLWRLDAIAATSAIVLWLAHVYSHTLGESLQIGRRLTLAEFASVARREYSVVLAAVVPVLAVALGAIALIPAATALWLAFGAGVITLGAQGARYARLESLGSKATIVTIALNLALGLALVAVEALIAH
jgi:hypothetical protein